MATVKKVTWNEAGPKLLREMIKLRKMVRNVLTDSQLDHVNCGTYIRKTMKGVEAAIAKGKAAR